MMMSQLKPYKSKVKGKNRDNDVSAKTFLMQQEFFLHSLPHSQVHQASYIN